MTIRLMLAVPALALTLAGCNRSTEGEPAAPATATTPAALASAAPASAAAAAVAGFDPAAAPLAAPSLGAFPFFSLLDGYQPMTKDNFSGDPAFEHVHDAAFDRYEFFDGVKLIPIEGRLKSVKAMGKGASFFQVQKTYEALVKAQGGVTVYEGKGAPMKLANLGYDDPRHRGKYKLEDDRMGVYMIRAADRQIWVEVYKAWESEDDSYWLTVVESKVLPKSASLLPAEAMKSALDAAGHVAIPVLFDNDLAVLKPESAPVIAEAVKLLKANPGLRLAVEGHTDNQGSAPHNLALSQARAKAVVAAIVAGGIDPARLTARGLGQTRPVADNAAEQGRAKNRRVELVKL